MANYMKWCGVVAAAGVLALPGNAAAVPAFARQTGASCSACHFQHFPGLTPFGRSFKSGGYVQTGGQEALIEADVLSVPASLYGSVVIKVRYVKTNGASAAGTDMGELQFPDEAAFFLGGRVGTHAGFLLEGQLADADAPMFASFKLSMGADLAGGRLTVTPFITDGLGAPFGFELLNTGAVRNVRTFEDRSAISAQQYVVAGGSEGEAEGVAFAFARHEGFFSVSPWIPTYGTVAVNRPAWYFRAAATPRYGAWDFGAGIQAWTGSANTVSMKTSAWAADAQAQGKVGRFPLGVYVTYARAGGTPAGAVGTDRNFFNAQPNAEYAVAALAELGVWPGRLTLGSGYRHGVVGRTGSPNDNAALMGATFLLAQNIEFQLNHVFYSGSAWASRADDQKTIVMLFAAF